MAALGALLASLFASLFSTTSLYYIALKIVLYGLFVTVLPIVLVKVWDGILEGVIGLVGANVGGAPGAFTWQVTGLTAFVFETAQIPASIGILLAAVSFRVTIRMIPFLGGR